MKDEQPDELPSDATAGERIVSGYNLSGLDKATLAHEIDKLQAFKDYVHERLDDAGIATHPEGEHSKHGCRIGDRLDIALKREIVDPEPWQPIHTVPKDGSEIRLLGDNGTSKHIGSWDPEGTSWADENGVACAAGLGEIQVTGFWASGSGWLQPNEVIAWQPLSKIEDRN